jgi:hypothetical protein
MPPAKVVLVDWATVRVLPAETATLALPPPEIVPERLLIDWLLLRLAREFTPPVELTTRGPLLIVPVAVVISVPAFTKVVPV